MSNGNGAHDETTDRSERKTCAGYWRWSRNRPLDRACALRLWRRRSSGLTLAQRTGRRRTGNQGPRHARFAVVIDVMSREGIVAGVDEAARKLGGLDILINNAGGVIAQNPAHLNPLDHDPRAFEDNLFLNLTQAFYATHAALPYMIKQKWGRIISIGSGYAKNGGGPLAYSAAKHGLIGMTRSLAYAAAPHGINLNVLCPGWTNTKLVNWDVVGASSGMSAENAKRFAESQNIQNRIVEPDELGAMAAMLSSDAAGAVTGQVISVDGGFMV